VGERRVGALADAGPQPVEQGDEGGEGGPVAGPVVVHGQHVHPGVFPAIPAHLDTRDRLAQFLAPAPTAAVAGVAECAHRRADDRGTRATNVVVADAYPIRDPPGEVLDDDVDAFAQAAEDLQALFALQVDWPPSGTCIQPNSGRSDGPNQSGVAVMERS